MTEGKVVSLSGAIAQPFFFDLETRANPSTFHLMPEPKAPANYKNPDKIAAYIANKKTERREKAALDHDHAVILSIGIKQGFRKQPTIRYIDALSSEDQEKDAIEWFWRLFERSKYKRMVPNPRAGTKPGEPTYVEIEIHGVATGWGIRRFDFPFLLRRSMALGIKIPLVPDLKKWSMLPIMDMQDVLHLWEQPYKGLKYYAKRYDLVSKLPEITGADVANMTPEETVAYQSDELEVQCQLYQKMAGVYWENELHTS